MKTNNQHCRSTLMLVYLQELLLIFTTVQYILFGTERQNSGRNRLNITQKLWNKTLFFVICSANPKAFPVVLSHLEKHRFKDSGRCRQYARKATRMRCEISAQSFHLQLSIPKCPQGSPLRSASLSLSLFFLKRGWQHHSSTAYVESLRAS